MIIGVKSKVVAQVIKSDLSSILADINEIFHSILFQKVFFTSLWFGTHKLYVHPNTLDRGWRDFKINWNSGVM